MTVAKHRTYAKSDIRAKKKETNTLEVYSSVHFNETPPRKFALSLPFEAVKDLEFIGCSVIFHENCTCNDTYRAPYIG